MSPTKDTVIIVGLGGPSSSGKSTVSRVLQQILPKVSIIYQDDFYLDDNKIPTEANGLQNWDCPEAFDLEKLSLLLEKVHESQEITPYYSKEDQNKIGPLPIEDEEIQELKQKVEKASQVLQNVHVILLDGIMLYQKDSPLLDKLDVKLYFRAPYKTLKARREARAGYATIEGFWQDPPGYFDDLVWPQYVKTHSYLFENGDVEGKLTSQARQELHFNTPTDTSSELSLKSSVDWTLDNIIRAL